MIGAGGKLELATAGSSRPISHTTTHSGIVTTTVFDLWVPLTYRQTRECAPRREACGASLLKHYCAIARSSRATATRVR